MQTLSPRLYADLVGKPYVRNGRGPDGYDCVGAVLMVSRRRGVDLPEYVTDMAVLHRIMSQDGASLSVLQKVSTPEPGDVVLMRSFGDFNRHLGMMVDPFRMLHASEPAGSVVIENLPRSIWGRRVLGFYRLPEVRA